MAKVVFRIRADKALRGYSDLLHDIDERLAPIVSKMVKEAERQQRVAERELKPRIIKINIGIRLGT